MFFRDFHPWFRLVANLWKGDLAHQVPEPPDGWTAFGQWLKDAKLAGLFHERAASAGLVEHFPAFFLCDLQQERYHILAHALQLEVLASEVCGFLSERGFKALPLKGLWLNRQVYCDASLRRTTDVDLLVSPGASDVLATFLVPKGYRRMPLEHAIEWQAVFKGTGLLPVEAHRLLSTPDENPPPSSEILERGKTWGQPGEGLASADAFVYLCLNNARDNLVVFPGNLADLVAVAKRFGSPEFWQEVVDRAQQWQWCTGVYLNLVAAREVFDLQVPRNVLRQLATPTWRRCMAKMALSRYRGKSPTVDSLPRGWGSLYKASVIEDASPLGYVKRRQRLVLKQRPL